MAQVKTRPLTRGPVSGTAIKARPKRPFFVDLYSTGVGKKYVMAVTGIIGMGYLAAHMVGNLKMYLGPTDLNHYGEFLRELLVPILPRTVTLWLLRSVLIVALILHVHAAYGLTVMNRKARTVGYQSKRDYLAANYASRTMRWSGPIVLLFIVWHLADLTWGWVNPDFVRGEPYQNLAHSFDRIPVALLYIVANLVLAVHLWHGAWSLFQSLGWNNPRFNLWRKYFAWGFTIVVIGGNISFPIAVMLNIVKV